MTKRYFLIFAALLMVSACSTSRDNGGIDTTGSSDIILSDDRSIYSDGQTDGPTPGTQTDLVVNVGDRVFFETDSSDLTTSARTTLENQARWLSQYDYLSVVVEGHADERGTREYNLALGERRANTVRNYLVALGVSPSRITTVTYGKERPAVPGSNATSWAQNRRGVTKVQ